MGTTVFVEDFNPKSGCWNRTLVVDLADFDIDVTYPSKYGGVVRIRYVDEHGNELSKDKVKTKPLTSKRFNATLEPISEEEIPWNYDKVEEKIVVKKSKKKTSLFK